MAHNRDTLPRATFITNLDATIRAEFSRLRASDESGGVIWSPERPAFTAELGARLRVVAEEARDALDLANREVARSQAALAEAEESGSRAQITRASNLRDTAIDIAAMTEVYWQRRENWLCACGSAIVALRPREQLIAAILAKRAAI
jgi:hypothetical protein